MSDDRKAAEYERTRAADGHTTPAQREAYELAPPTRARVHSYVATATVGDVLDLDALFGRDGWDGRYIGIQADQRAYVLAFRVPPTTAEAPGANGGTGEDVPADTFRPLGLFSPRERYLYVVQASGTPRVTVRIMTRGAP